MYNTNVTKKIYSYFINKLGMRPYRRGWLKGDCPYCGRSQKFGVNIESDRCHCFICGDHNTPTRMIMDLEGLELYKDLWLFFKTFEGVEYFEKLPDKKLELPIVKLPDEYINIKFGDTRFGCMARNYLQNVRGFDIDELALKGYGYCREGKYMGYIIIPFFINGKLYYFNTRKFFGTGPKYDNPTIDDIGIGKSSIIYNIDALWLHETVYITEGVFNAETIGDEGIATGGKGVSPYQISTIIKSPVKKLVLLLDPDAVPEAIELGLDLVFYKDIKLVYWDGDKDVNDLGKEETMKIVNKFPYLCYNDLLKMKHGKKSLLAYY